MEKSLNLHYLKLLIYRQYSQFQIIVYSKPSATILRIHQLCGHSYISKSKVWKNFFLLVYKLCSNERSNTTSMKTRTIQELSFECLLHPAYSPDHLAPLFNFSSCENTFGGMRFQKVDEKEISMIEWLDTRSEYSIFSVLNCRNTILKIRYAYALLPLLQSR